MALIVVCYNGHQFLVENEFAGRKVVCPVCDLTVPVPRPKGGPGPASSSSAAARVAPAPLRTIERDDAPEPLEPRFARVRLGLGLFYAQQIALLGGVICGLVVVFLLPLIARVTGAELPILVGTWVAAPLLAVQKLLGVGGSVLCLGVYRRSEAWWYAVASLAAGLAAGAAAACLVLYDVPVFLAGMVDLASWICFILFLRALAYFLEQPGYANVLAGTIVQGIALWVAVPLLLVLIGLWTFVAGHLGFYLTLTAVVLVLWLVAMTRMMYGILEVIGTLWKAIGARLPRTSG